MNVPQPIPAFPLPLVPDDGEPVVDLGAILAALYNRARYDLSLDYTEPPVPPLTSDAEAWVREVIAAHIASLKA